MMEEKAQKWSDDSGAHHVKGGAIGTGGGAVVGGLIGHAAGNTALGAILGAAVGGTAGAVIGHNMDNQADEMKRDLKNARIERVGEGNKITFDSGILFASNSSELQRTAKANVESLAKILNKYPDKGILLKAIPIMKAPQTIIKSVSFQRSSPSFIPLDDLHSLAFGVYLECVMRKPY